MAILQLPHVMVLGVASAVQRPLNKVFESSIRHEKEIRNEGAVLGGNSHPCPPQIPTI